MTSVSDVFAIVIKADGQGAIREFEKVGNAADKELGRTEDRVTRLSNSMVKYGAAATAGGVVAARGLYMAAQAAQSLADSGDKVTAVFGAQGTTALDQYAKGAADSMGMSKAAALDAASAYGVLLKQSGVGGAALVNQASALATRTADLAERFKKPYAEVQKAIEATLKTGSGKALKGLLGVDIQIDPKMLTGMDIASKTATIFDEIMKQSADSAGFFGKSTDDLGVQLQKANAAAENAKAAFGEAALPAITKVAEAGAKILEVFGKMPEPLQNAIGTIAVLGTGVALIGGPLSMLGGGILKATDGLKTLRARFGQGAEGAGLLSTGLGKVGASLGLLATAFVASDALMGVINNINGISEATDEANKKLRILEGQGRLATSEAADTIAEQMRNKIGELDISNVWGDFGSNVSSVTLGFDNSIERVQRALDSLSSDKAKAAMLDILEADTAKLDSSSESFRVNTDFIERNREKLTENAEALKATGQATGDLGRATDETSGKVSALGDALLHLNEGLVDGQSGYSKYASALQAALNPLDGLVDANSRLEAAQGRLAEAAKVDASAVTSAYEGLERAKKHLDDVLNENRNELSQVSPEVELANARKRLMEANARIAQGGGADAITAKDEALADIERAIRRRQDLKKTADERAIKVRDARQGVADAQRTVGEAKVKGGVDSPEYKAAQKDIEKARLDVAMSTFELAGAIAEGKTSIEEIGGQLDAFVKAGLIPADQAATMKATYQALADQVKWTTTVIGDATTLMNKQVSDAYTQAETRRFENTVKLGKGVAQGVANAAARITLPTGGGLFSGRGRATGGPTSSGTSYTINENGTETLMMGRRSGYVLNAGLTASRAAQSSAASGGDTVKIEIREAVSARRTAEEVIKARRRSAFLGGR